MEKPRNVVIATSLLWGSLALGVVRSIVVGLNAPSRFGPLFVPLVAGGTLAIMALFVYQIGKGRNWARIVFAVLFGLGLPACIPILTTLLVKSPVQAVFSLVQIALQGYAMYLVFTKPGSVWFQKKTAESAQSDVNN